jgi:hypothetical protein
VLQLIDMNVSLCVIKFDHVLTEQFVTVVGGQFVTVSLAATLWKPIEAPIMLPAKTTNQSSSDFELEIWSSFQMTLITYFEQRPGTLNR